MDIINLENNQSRWYLLGDIQLLCALLRLSIRFIYLLIMLLDLFIRKKIHVYMVVYNDFKTCI
jgi:hypothetical protein